MRKLRKVLRDKPHVAIGVPAILCFITFVTNLIASLKDGVIDPNEMHQLLTTADGFQAVALFIIVLILKEKNK